MSYNRVMMDLGSKIKKFMSDVFWMSLPLIFSLGSLSFFNADTIVLYIVIMFWLLLVLPGLFIYRIINETAKLSYNPFFVFLTSFVIGLSVLLYPSLVIYIFRLNLEYLLYSQILICFVSFMINLFYVKNKSVRFEYNRINITLAAVMVLFLTTAILKGSHEAGDAVFHITYIRNLIDNIPINPFEAHIPVEAINPSSGYSLWYLVLALIGRVVGTESYVVWRSSIYFLSMLLPLGVFYFAKAILKKPKYAIWALLVFCFYYLYRGYLNDSTTVTYPDRVARLIMIPVVVFIFQKILASKEKITNNLNIFIPFVLIMGAVFSVHMFSWMFFFIFLLIFFLIDVVVKKKKIKSVKFYLYTFLSVILITLPALLLKLDSILKYSVNSSNPMGGKRDKYLIYYDNGMLSFKPEYLLSIGLLTTSIGFLIYYGINNYKKKKAYWYYYAWFVVLIPITIMLFPPLTTVGYKLFSMVYISRLLSFVPVFIIIGGIFGAFLHKSRMEFLAIFLLFVMIFQIKTTVNHRPNNIENIDGVYEFIQNEIPDNSTIISNLWDSYYLAAYSNNYIVGTYSVHMTSNVDGKGRATDIEEFLKPGHHEDKRTEIINKYNIDYLLIRKKAPAKRGYKIYWNASMALYSSESVDVFNSNDKYTKIYEDREFDLYKVVQ